MPALKESFRAPEDADFILLITFESERLKLVDLGDWT
jgi:endogenous inhibitor of DNA gyrase (YacG/DUF329 family)